MRVDADGQIGDAALLGCLGPRRAAHRTSPKTTIAERVLDELRTSVKLRKVSDVPVGVFLSGGIDSSTNAALFSRGRNAGRSRRSPSATPDNYDSYQNELAYAREDGRSCVGADHHELLLTPRRRRATSCRRWSSCRTSRSPIRSACPCYYVAKLARQHGVVVCQVGEGADELFIGYPSWLASLGCSSYDDLPVPSAVKRLALGAAQRARLRPDLSLRVAPARRARPAAVLGWRRSVHRCEKRLAPVDPRLRAIRGLTSWDALAPIRARFEDARAGNGRI